MVQLGLREVPERRLRFSNEIRRHRVVHLHLIALFTLQCRCLMMVQVMKLKSLLGEEKLAARVTRDVRVSGVDDLMRLQAGVVVKS